MNILEIYKQYKIPPNLQEHQLRVAAVGSIISDNINVEVDKNNLVKACLLHDMGNIIKFDLTIFLEFLEPEGIDYWRKVKDEFIDQYGEDEHVATYSIMKELGVSEKVERLVKASGFSKAESLYKSENFAEKIVFYSDARVTPHGIGTLSQRLEDGTKRYVKNQQSKGVKTEQGRKNAKWDLDLFNRLSEFVRKLEVQIFSESNINPEDINNDTVEKVIPKLRLLEL